MEWFRLYDGIIDDPKILQLSPEFRWFFVGLLAISSRQSERGTLPKREEIALHLRIQRRRVESVIATFIDLGLIDVSEDGQTLSMHGWERRQFKSDDITARTKAFKERSRERSHPPSRERASRARSESETESENTLPSNSISEPAGDATRVSGDVAGTVHETEAEQRARERAELNADLRRRRNGPS